MNENTITNGNENYSKTASIKVKSRKKCRNSIAKLCKVPSWNHSNWNKKLKRKNTNAWGNLQKQGNEGRLEHEICDNSVMFKSWETSIMKNYKSMRSHLIDEFRVVDAVEERHEDHVAVLLLADLIDATLEAFDDLLAVLGRPVPQAQHGHAGTVARVQNLPNRNEFDTADELTGLQGQNLSRSEAANGDLSNQPKQLQNIPKGSLLSSRTWGISSISNEKEGVSKRK